MKVPLEILTLIILIWLGWSQSYHDQWSGILGQPASRTRSAQSPKLRSPPAAGPNRAAPPAPPAAAATPAGQPKWMRDPTILDRQR